MPRIILSILNALTFAAGIILLVLVAAVMPFVILILLIIWKFMDEEEREEFQVMVWRKRFGP